MAAFFRIILVLVMTFSETGAQIPVPTPAPVFQPTAFPTSDPTPIELCCDCTISSSDWGCPLDKTCETIICERYDNYCCLTKWDIICANTSKNICETRTIRPQPIYDECWKIESDPPCNDRIITDNLWCHWDSFDASCMCRIREDNINVIYLVDISLSASPTQSDFSNIAALIQDVTDSTLNISPSQRVFNQIILYDQMAHILTPNIDITQIDITQFNPTQFNDLSVAISTAIGQFEFELEEFSVSHPKRRVLVIFNGEMQKDYLDDDVGVCSMKSTLNDQEITVIIVSYTINDESQGGTETLRNLECLIDPSSDDAHNNISYASILGAAPPGWDGSVPIEAKLSWDLCNTALPTTYFHHVMTNHVPCTQCHCLIPDSECENSLWECRWIGTCIDA